jgi:hypothetical protein
MEGVSQNLAGSTLHFLALFGWLADLPSGVLPHIQDITNNQSKKYTFTLKKQP